MRQIAIAALTLVMWAGLVSAQDKPPGWLGVEVSSVDDALVKKHGLPLDFGAYVDKIEPQSPAKDGLADGDVITSVNGVLVRDKPGFDAVLSPLKVGDAVIIGRFRPGESAKKIEVRLAATPTVQPASDALRLMLDTGGHTAVIKGLAWTPDGKYVVSTGHDKVIRIWDPATGKIVRTIRGEVGPGREGKIFAMALSPDGRWLAAGGWTDRADAHAPCCGDIRLYDFATGKLVRLLLGHTDMIVGLAFSPDGSRLISGSGPGDRSAIIWDVATGKMLHRLEGHATFVTAVGFTPGPTLEGKRALMAVTGSYDTTLKLWDATTGGLLTTMSGHKDKVESLAVSPLGDIIASGSNDGEIRLWDALTGKPLKVLASHVCSVGKLAFHPSQPWLLSTCGGEGGKLEQNFWDISTGQSVASYTGHDDIVLDAALSPEGRWVATGGFNGEVHVWDPQSGERRMGPDGRPLVLEGTGRPVWAVGVTADATRIGWGNHPGNNNLGSLEFALRLPTPTTGLSVPELLHSQLGQEGQGVVGEWRRAVAAVGGVTLSRRKGGNYGYDAILDVVRDGKVVASLERSQLDGYGHASYTFSPDGKTIISGGALGVIQSFDLAAVELAAAAASGNLLKGDNLDKLSRNFFGHESDVGALATSPDGRFLVSGSADQTVRLWNLKTGELIVSLFVSLKPDGALSDWVMWTPQGYFTGSAGAGDIVGWQLNQGPDHEARLITGGQLRKQFERPDIVSKAIQFASATEAVKQSLHTDYKLANLLTRPVPKVRIVSPAPEARLDGATARLKFEVEGPAASYRAIVNGQRIGGGSLNGSGHEIALPLAEGDNLIEVVAVNADNVESNLQEGGRIHVLHQGQGTLDKRGTLYVIAIGVDKYPGLGTICGTASHPTSCDLSFAGADARALADMLVKRLGPMHETVAKPHVLINAKEFQAPTRANILDSLGEVHDLAKPNDTVVLFAAGHGLDRDGGYLFIPTDAARQGTRLRTSTVLDWTEMQKLIANTNGRRLMFLDTCHSGNAPNSAVASEARSQDIVAFLATGPAQSSLEQGPPIGHGLFTYALINRLEGKAVTVGPRNITVDQLAGFLKSDTLELIAKVFPKLPAFEAPVPQMVKGRDAKDYEIARW